VLHVIDIIEKQKKPLDLFELKIYDVKYFRGRGVVWNGLAEAFSFCGTSLWGKPQPPK
jgi:hypothetical protein